MGTIIDILALVILAVAIYLGYKKGFIKSVMGLVSLIVSIILAIIFYSYPAAYLKENVIEPHFVDSTSDTFSALMNGGTEVIPPEKIFEDEPDTLTETAERFGVDVSAIKEYYDTVVKNITDALSTEEIADELSKFVVESTVATISNVLGFAAVFFGSLLILTLLLMLINLIFKLPVLKLANKLTGAVLGALKAVLIITVLVNILVHLASANGNVSNITAGTDYFWSIESISASTTYSIINNAGFIF